MHDHRRIAYGTVAEVLQKVVEDLVILLHVRHCSRDQVLDQPRPLKETDRFFDITIVVRSTYEISRPHNMP